MLLTPHTQTMNSDRQSKTARLIARLFGTLSWIIAFIMAVILFSLLLLPWALPTWAWALTMVFTIIVGGFLIFLTEKYERKYLEKAGYGIKSLEKSGATTEGNLATITLRDRKVIADIIKTTELSTGSYTRRPAGVTYTRISVEHKGNIPCVTQVSLEGKKRINLLDKDIYLQWKKEYPRRQFSLMPRKVYLNDREVPGVLPEETIITIAERVERVVNDPGMTILKGFITIEPGWVWWLRRKDLLPQELLQNAVNILVDIARNIEKEYQPLKGEVYA